MGHFYKIIAFLCIYNLIKTNALNKYSAEANIRDEEISNFRNLDKPFRMAKLNMLWSKAQLVST